MSIATVSVGLADGSRRQTWLDFNEIVSAAEQRSEGELVQVVFTTADGAIRFGADAGAADWLTAWQEYSAAKRTGQRAAAKRKSR